MGYGLTDHIPSTFLKGCRPDVIGSFLNTLSCMIIALVTKATIMVILITKKSFMHIGIIT